MSNLVKCTDCGHHVSINAKACPSCGAPPQYPSNQSDNVIDSTSKNSDGNRGCLFWVITSIVVIFSIVTIFSDSPPATNKSNLSNHNTSTRTKTASTPTQICETGAPISGKIYITSDNVNFRTGPGPKFENVINEKATAILKRKEYRVLSPEYGLQAMCEKDGWIQAQIVEVDGRPNSWEKGWVNKKFTSGAMSADQQAGLYWNIDQEKDFTKKEKEILKKGAMKVLNDEPNCKQITTGYRSGSKKGQYYVTCDAKNNGTPFNVWFSPGEVMKGTSLNVPKVYPEASSRIACEEAIKNNAIHPSTLDINRIVGYATSEHNNGNRTIIQDFSAKNSFNLTLKYQARCLILPSGEVELTVKEIGN